MNRTSHTSKPYLAALIAAIILLTTCFSLAASAAEAFTGTFAVEGGEAAVDVYYTQDLSSADETGASSALARDGDTGEILTDGNGQINFVITPAAGYAVAAVTATSGAYKNIKDVSTETVKNAYRITKITADLTVTVTLAPESQVDTGDPVITFTNSAAAVSSGNAGGVEISGTAVRITAAGVYTFTGSCSSGSIVVKKNVTGVTLVLSGLTLKASATAPITCNKGSGVAILAAAGTVNNLSDDQYNNDDIYTDTAAYPDIENAVIKCKDGSNVTIGGAGTINVYSYGKNGVKGGYDLYEEDADGNVTDTLLSTASLTIKDVTLNITAAVNDGLKADKVLSILSGNITVSAADDGIKSDYTLNIGAAGTAGPTVRIIKSYEGIEAATLNVYSGSVSVTATDDGVNAANSDLGRYSFSYNQSGGYMYINCANGDGLDSNGSITLSGGVLEVYSPAQGDGDPIDADGGICFSGATVLGVGNNAMHQGYTASTPYVTFGGSAGGMGGPGGFGGFGGFGSASTLVSAGSTISIRDAAGSVIYTAQSAAPRSAGYVVFSSPALSSGSSYSLYSGSASAGTAAASVNSSGGNPGGFGPGGQGGFGPGGPGNDPQYSGGDVNRDGRVTAADARLALRAAVGLETYTAGSAQFTACDTNRDGRITAADARIILRMAVGLA